MRQRRIKSVNRSAVYHLISRTVAGEHLLGEEEREVLRKQMRQMAAFCGVEILTYCLLSNHFHLLVLVPPQGELSDEELVRRYAVLYGSDEAKVLGINLAHSERREEIRERLLRRMNDISFFMKELKLRFTIYYNRRHERFGTLWAERFKSLLVESRGRRNAVLSVAAYIDLNPVRAGLCEDPKEYRFCGYAESLGGGKEARDGLSWIIDGKPWPEVLRWYRMVLFGAGYASDRSKEGGISWERSREVLEAGGELPAPELLRCRIRYFSDGLALGSARFVRAVRKRVFGKQETSGGIPEFEETGLCFARRKRRLPPTAPH